MKQTQQGKAADPKVIRKIETVRADHLEMAEKRTELQRNMAVLVNKFESIYTTRSPREQLESDSDFLEYDPRPSPAGAA